MNNQPDSDAVSWDELAQSIADGEAVLVLGPDALPFYPVGDTRDAPQSFSELSRNRVLELPEGKIEHYFQRDNLFQFHDAGAKQEAMKAVRSAARDRRWLPDAELLRQIVEIPFQVVVSINPDKYLFEAFVQYWREPQFDFFTTKLGRNLPALKPPSADTPLLYNLCGSVQDKLDSVLLDYHDLFEFLKSLLSDHGVPPELTDKLRTADRFILLGFDLERWYFQLFLHYINKLDSNPFNNFNQNFPILSRVGAEAKVFVENQFNIRHVTADRSDFERLYEACDRRKLLRRINNAAAPGETQLRLLTVQGKYDEAFALLLRHAPGAEQEIEITMLQGRYQALLAQEQAGALRSDDALTERNRIRYALLTFAHALFATPKTAAP